MEILFKSFAAALLFTPAVTLVFSRWVKTRLVSSVLLCLSMVAGATVAGICFWRGDRVVADFSPFTPLPFALTLDRLSAFFVLLISVVAAPVAVFSASYVERHYQGARRTWIWVLLPLFMASMVLVVVASTAFAFLFGWELMTLFSAGLVLVDGDSEPRRHNLYIYLLMMHAGAAAVVAAFLLFLPHAPGLDFASMRAGAALMGPGLRSTIFLLAFLGFGTKAGIVPLHLWLPKAHPIAPSPVSALMSGVMLKTAVYGFVRFAFDFLGTGPAWWGYGVLGAGALTAVLGVLYALAEDDVKRLLAYSSVENIGIIYLGLAAALLFRSHQEPVWATVALVAALLHSISHGLFKSALFLGAGAISDATHSLEMEGLGGLLKRMPVTGTACLVACCSIAGLPLFNGFVSEWLTFRSFLAGSEISNLPVAIVLPLTAGVLALVGGLAAAVFAKLYGSVFLGRPRSHQAEAAHEIPATMQVGMAVLAVACIVVGVAPGILVIPLSQAVGQFLPGAALPDQALAVARVVPWLAILAVAVAGLFAAWHWARRITPTWACGLPGLDSRMQYTATAFSKPLRKVFAQVYKPERTLETVPLDPPYFPTAISYRSVRTTSFERSLYRPAVDAIVAAAHRLRRLQTGNIQVYLLYMFLALVALLVYMRFA